MAQIWLNMQDLAEVSSGLKTTIDEFKAAAKSNDDGAGAVAHPDDRSELFDVVHEFEAEWAAKRDKLKGGLEDLQERLDGVIAGWTAFDREAAKSMGHAGHDNQPVGGMK
ncbi:hypothetical protein E3T26_13970 [Cryobacterium sp. TMT1-21]|uniref:Flagellar protein FlgN n=1 Tax=Cryobacterium shii TaxID=1259235 RepID=A0AAQ2HEY0_9MICO|nr:MULTISPECIES: hypothetical protein [Cryobacterium]TFC43425.1 hypothetical protein E3O49_13270 [Cryobacterium shii]TFC89593.1 hypothetical protein E3T24_00800 [Cryobacterium sp. TmT2-59]TFD10467.1 hypothetical protein E3T26_13970 [Cryobacterium sp. TMT1-21]TFD14193.1 hypothetical protein E3T42_12000 [Cryobacterium sp. TMT4-10]TFD20225.1 hypothetical protein E3T32_09335 [Cryobacterium sp. TMT2-23]